MDMLKDKIIDLLSKKTKCPVCGEECISWYKKGFYTNFWKEKECPNCKAMRLPHNVCPSCGFYKDRVVVAQKAAQKEEAK